MSHKKQQNNVNELHQILGHVNYPTTRSTVKHLDIQLTGQEVICEEFLIVKMKTK